MRDGETWEANARYARNIIPMKPLLKGAWQRARYCVAVDSTCRSDLPIDNLMPDVLVLTMPLSRFDEVAEMGNVRPELERVTERATPTESDLCQSVRPHGVRRVVARPGYHHG